MSFLFIKLLVSNNGLQRTERIPAQAAIKATRFGNELGAAMRANFS
jgi:hypothetical protein